MPAQLEPAQRDLAAIEAQIACGEDKLSGFTAHPRSGCVDDFASAASAGRDNDPAVHLDRVGQLDPEGVAGEIGLRAKFVDELNVQRRTGGYEAARLRSGRGRLGSHRGRNNCCRLLN